MKLLPNKWLKNWGMFASFVLVLGQIGTPFAALAVAGPGSSISITDVSPSGCILEGTEVTVSGSATAVAPPGNLSQYHVQLDWGNGSTDDQTESSSFSVGDSPDHGTQTRTFSGSHTYATAGNYTVTARIYHQNVPGQDNEADAVASVEICVEPPTPTFAVSGTKFNDQNEDGDFDVDEPGLSGWTIYIDENGNDAFDTGEPSTLTDGNGDYSFTLEAGAYTLREVAQVGWTQTFPAGDGEQTATVTDANVADLDFGNHQDPVVADPGSISGSKFNDENENGVWDEGELGLEGWTIYLDLNEDGDFDDGTDVSTVTGTDGSYSFTDLEAGTYVVREVNQLGWTQTLPGDGDNYEYSVPVDGDDTTRQDFGNHLAIVPCTDDGSISGKVYEDNDESSSYTEGDDLLVDWQVYLDLNDNGSLDEGEPVQVTDEAGQYQFTGLEDGTYVVREVVQSDWTQVQPGEEDGFSHEVTLDCSSILDILGDFFQIAAVSGNVATDIDFGNVQNPSNTGGGGGSGSGSGGTPTNGGGTPTTPGEDVAGEQDRGNGTISGIVFNDANGNGAKDVAEVPLAGWEVYLDADNDNQLDSGETKVLTNVMGEFTFANLTWGTYHVRQVLQTGWSQIAPTSAADNEYVLTLGPVEAVAVTVNGNQATGLVFANQVPNQGNPDEEVAGEQDNGLPRTGADLLGLSALFSAGAAFFARRKGLFR